MQDAFGIGLVNNAYIVIYTISIVDMSEDRHIVYLYNTKTVEKKGVRKCWKN